MPLSSPTKIPRLTPIRHQPLQSLFGSPSPLAASETTGSTTPDSLQSLSSAGSDDDSPTASVSPARFGTGVTQPSSRASQAPSPGFIKRLFGQKSWAGVCGLGAGTAAAACAPAMMPTATLWCNQAILGTASFVVAGSAVAYDARLPARLAAAAIGALVGAALLLQAAPCAAPLALVIATTVGALFGYKAIQHRQAIAMALLACAAVGLTWWAATIVGPRAGYAVPALHLVA